MTRKALVFTLMVAMAALAFSAFATTVNAFSGNACNDGTASTRDRNAQHRT